MTTFIFRPRPTYKAKDMLPRLSQKASHEGSERSKRAVALDENAVRIGVLDFPNRLRHPRASSGDFERQRRIFAGEVLGAALGT